MFYLYILKSLKYNKSYVGCTNNLERRLKQHNNGDHIYTKRYVPWIIVYSERLKDRKEARTREIYFKSSTGRRWMRDHIFNNADVAELVYAQP
ncbi:MAG: GIY-YIG nuclease family protein [Candidatus Gottesmanbacteria bacterium]|nr:GIY-YIG nuclease family protein [Candidatus Gottesmanbacteria bacterium]